VVSLCIKGLGWGLEGGMERNVTEEEEEETGEKLKHLRGI